MTPACKNSPDETRHYWRWEPVDGQDPDRLPRKGMWRVTCGHGCGWTKEVFLAGDEAWQA